MKKNIHLIYIITSIGFTITFSNCKKDTNNNSSITPPTKINHIVGYAQKGPFVSGSSVTLYDLQADLSPTGKTYNSQIIDNKGTFTLDSISLTSNYAMLKADGFYYNEVIGGISGSQITLYALSDVSNKTSLNINLLTTLEKDRVKYLIQTGKSFSAAKQQAEKEILAIFGIVKSNITLSENLNIAEDGDDNAILLAVSAILQSTRSEGPLTELLATINNDIKGDGILNSDSLYSDLLNGTIFVDTTMMKNNLIKRYSALGVTLTVSDFGKYIANFISTASLKLTGSDIFYPKIQGATENLLALNDTVYYFNKGNYITNYYSMSAYVPQGKSLSIKLYELDTDPTTQPPHFGYDAPNGNFIQPGIDSSLYEETITPNFLGIYYHTDLMIKQVGRYLIEYFIDGILTRTKIIKLL